MKFPRALKVTKASARVSAIFLRLSEVCRKIEADSGRLATEARTFWCMSHAVIELSHHLPGRLVEADSLLRKLDGAELAATDPESASRALVLQGRIEVRTCIADLRALVDEVRFTLDNAPVEPVQVPAPPKPSAVPTVPAEKQAASTPKHYQPLAGKKPVDTSAQPVHVKPYSENKVPYRHRAQTVQPEIVTLRPRRVDSSEKDR